VGGITSTQGGEHPGKPVGEKPSVALASLAGGYLREELDTFFDLSVEDGKLVIRNRRFGPAALTHTNGDNFSGTLPVTQVAFRRDEQGNVTGFDAGNGRARGIIFKKVSR